MSRSYRLLCPIARGLDRVGDRWTLLILRDLHAGPMRFGDLLDGLPGLASNLLATRLEKLQADGLVKREDQHYALTDLGRDTDRVLWELAQLGMRFPPDPDLKRPGHLRLAAVTLQNALRRVELPDPGLLVELVLDGESFAIDTRDPRSPTVRYGRPVEPQVIATTSYEPMMAAAGGEIALHVFRSEHVELTGEPEATKTFAELMSRVMVEGFAADE